MSGPGGDGVARDHGRGAGTKDRGGRGWHPSRWSMASASLLEIEAIATRAAHNARLLATVERQAAEALEHAAVVARDDPTPQRRRRAATRALVIAEHQERLAQWFETPPDRRGSPPAIHLDE